MLFILLTLVFVVLRVMPGDPVRAVLGAHAPPHVIEEKRIELGLDKPLVVHTSITSVSSLGLTWVNRWFSNRR